MKSRINERGSAAHIVIIVVLVIAVLGLVGYVFWQNFVTQPADQAEQTTTQESDLSQLETSYLELSTLGVKVPYLASEDTYTAGTPNEFGAVALYSSVAADAGCSYTEGNEPEGFIGSVAAFDASDEVIAATTESDFFRKVTLGEKTFTLSSPQNTCGSNIGIDEATIVDIQQSAFLRFADQFEKLEAL